MNTIDSLEPSTIVRPTALLINSGSGREDRALAVEDIATRLDVPEERIARLSPGDDIAAKARALFDAGARTIVVGGGDGTICGAATGLMGTDATMAVLPLGTFNFFARSLGIPDGDLDTAIAIAKGPTTRAVNLGEINGRIFINNASLGAYASILDQREAIYKRWGRSRLMAYWSVLVAMATVYRPLTMRITVDGEVRRAKTPMAFIAMSAYQLDQYEIEGADAVREGKFALLLAPDAGRFMLIWRALKIALRGVKKNEDFTLITGHEALIETRRSHRLVARDGEREKMAGPYEIRVLRDAIRVHVPEVMPDELA